MIDKLEKVIAHYQKALTIKYDNAIVHSKLGKLYEAQNKFEAAIYHYIKAIQVDPSYFQVYWDLKFSLLRSNQLEISINYSLLKQGITIIRHSIQHQPDFLFARVVLGNLLTYQGQAEEAIYCYRTASFNQTKLSYPNLVEYDWDFHHKRHPDFLIPGFIKCGTTSLYSYLECHPQILPAVEKEVGFFTYFFEQRLDWYLAHFPAIPTSNNYLTGEATPVYVNYPSMASKILDLFPKLKLIILLRNPIDRAISSYYHENKVIFKFKQIPSNITATLEKIEIILKKLPDLLLLEPSIFNTYKDEYIEYILDDALLPYLLNSLYIYYLEQWLIVFPKEQLLILKSEDLFGNPSATMKQVHNFLNISEYQLSQYRNSNPGSYPPIHPELRYQLVEFFHPYNQRLEEYLEMTFSWE